MLHDNNHNTSKIPFRTIVLSVQNEEREAAKEDKKSTETEETQTIVYLSLVRAIHEQISD